MNNFQEWKIAKIGGQKKATAQAVAFRLFYTPWIIHPSLGSA